MSCKYCEKMDANQELCTQRGDGFDPSAEIGQEETNEPYRIHCSAWNPDPWGDERISFLIPINYCPMCGERLVMKE